MPASRYRFRELRYVGRPVGAVLVGLALTMLLTDLVAWLWERASPNPALPQGGNGALLLAALLTGVVGAALHTISGPSGKRDISRREALLAVMSIWLGAGFFGAVPFVLAADLSPVDALFESVSGLTTTGSTVIADIERRLSRPLLLWRSVIQWLGGMGIVVLFVAVFPNVGAGGKHLYRGEAPGAQVEGLRPRIRQTSAVLWRIYLALTALLFVILVALGMESFEALCHALTTLATGGFSTRDASIGAFGSPAIEWVLAVFMLLSGVSYGLYYALLRTGSGRSLLANVELRVYAALVVGSWALLSYVNRGHHEHLLDGLRASLFTVATHISSTGYGTEGTDAYPSSSLGIVLLLMVVGGCSGSTAGGLKVERLVIVAKQSYAQIRHTYEPSVVQVVRLGRRVVERGVVADVMSFFAVYFVTLLGGVLAVATLDGVPLPTAFGATLTCLSNIGPAPFHGLAGFDDNFVAYGAASKLVFSAAMIIGRLEFFTFFALMIPGFWRR
jgi:trk system potassium uptake protein